MRRPPRSKRTDNSFPTRRSSDLLRWQEGDQVMATFAEHLGVKVIRVDAAERYFAALAGIHDPEAKRKIIGRLFVEIFDEQAAKLHNIKWLAQGTIYPDVIESAGSKTRSEERRVGKECVSKCRSRG